jgi:2-oxoglutarate dehydrogenase E2 component (dihydrolipoamide succinyltransferase)
MVSVPMPHMGVSVEEGTVIEWLKAVGDEVAAEEAICAIATDKVDTEVLAPADGVLAKQLVGEGDSVAVGEPLAELAVGADAAAAIDAAGEEGASAQAAAGEEGASSEAASAGDRPQAEPQTSSQGASPTGGNGAVSPATPGAGTAERAAAGRDQHGRFDPAAAAAAAVSSPREGKLASPVARRIAATHGIDLEAVEGSGLRGRIRKADVLEAVSQVDGPKSADIRRKSAHQPAVEGLPAGYDGVPHEVVATTRVRQVIAEHMIRSRQTAAHMTTEVDVDLSAVIRARGELNEARLGAGAPKLSFLPFIARAACVALGEHPDLNSTFLGDRKILWRTVNLGVAVDTPEGLLVPVVRECDRLTAPAIGDAIVDLAERARNRRLTPDDLAGGTFTLSNPGSVGAVSAPAIINQPQVAILGVPTIQRRPWVIADEHGQEAIGIRSILRLAVTFDHRAVDGANATRFAVAVKEHLEAWAPEAYT